jgi:hypothetical protein
MAGDLNGTGMSLQNCCSPANCQVALRNSLVETCTLFADLFVLSIWHALAAQNMTDANQVIDFI